MDHDDRRGSSTHDRIVRLVQWDPPCTTTRTSALDSLQGPVWQTKGPVRHTESMATHDPTNDIKGATSTDINRSRSYQ
jgi:hypothetical protein